MGQSFSEARAISAPAAEANRRRVFKALKVAGALLALYAGAFLCLFDVLSPPVRDNDHGWLGPAIRGDAHLIDIGEVYYRESDDYLLYGLFAPLCELWLAVNGL